MSPTSLLPLLRSPHLVAKLRLRRDLRAFLRLQFLAVAAQMELLPHLQSPKSSEALARRLGLADRELLTTLLDLGVALRELRGSRAGYVLRGRTSRALATSTGTSLSASIEELVDYHTEVYAALPQHLLDGQQRDYLSGRGELIVRSSRLVEPALAALTRSLVAERGPMSILELGCGSGVYLRHAGTANPHARGIGVELQPTVASVAGESLKRWGAADRFAVLQGDARRLPAAVGGDFDLITLYNNIYYFTPDERDHLLGELRSRLRPGGKLVIASMLRGRTPASLSLSLVLAATRGCTALPSEASLLDSLRRRAFTRIGSRRLLPGEPFMAVAGERPTGA